MRYDAILETMLPVALSGWLACSVAWEDVRPSVATDRLVALFDRISSDYDKLPPRLKPLLPFLVWALDRKYMLGRPPTLSHTGDPLCTRLALKVPPGEPNRWTKRDCADFARIAQYALFSSATLPQTEL